MSRRKILWRKKIAQCKASGKSVSVLIPSNMKKKVVLDIIKD